MQAKIGKQVVDAATATEGDLWLWDTEVKGFGLRVRKNGGKTYILEYRPGAGGRTAPKRRYTIGKHGSPWTPDKARSEAIRILGRVKDGKDPAAEKSAKRAKGNSFKAVAENYVARHVTAKGLRSKGEIERILNSYIYPAWKDRPFAEIRRGDVTKLLDAVQDKNGARQADYVLAVVRAIMNWQASRTDDYVSPITRGMRRTDPKDRKRDRILDDDELRLIWRQAEAEGAFGAIVRLALLTAQRREKIAAMKWDDVSVDGTWNIPAEDREKGNGGALVLPDAALAIVRAQKRIEGNDYVFPGRAARGRKIGEGHFQGFSPCKRAFDDKIAEAMREAAVQRGENPEKVKPLPRWTLHDLRRTARSIMSRAGVRPDLAERVMGHAITGVEGVYDRHSYRDEKADALMRLASMIDVIREPREGNVVALRGSAA